MQFSCLYKFKLQVKDINARLERIEPKVRSSDGLAGNFPTGEIKTVSLNPKKSSPKAKSSTRETSLFGGWYTLIASCKYSNIFSWRLIVNFLNIKIENLMNNYDFFFF